MNVSDAVSARSSIRAFKDKPVDSNLIKSLLIKSSRSPSGGNLQPWKIFVLNGQSMIDFLEFHDFHHNKKIEPKCDENQENQPEM